MPRTQRLLAALTALAVPLAALPLLAASALPAGAAPDPSTPPPTPGPSEPIAASTVLISEVANGGGGADTNAARVSADNFMEITNYGDQPVDISGWRLLRCGQTGDAYGPQKAFGEGTVLAPGEPYTVAGPTANPAIARDATYDETGTNLHEFGFGAWLERRDHTVVDRVGFYHPSVFSDCGQGDRALDRALDHRLSESHQRVAATGDVATDWAVAGRTPDAANATTGTEKRVETGLRITEVAGGDRASDSNQYVELTNTGDAELDITGWRLFRCGENGTAYLQNASLPDGLLAPGASYVVGNAAATDGVERDATYSTNMHWRDFGAMVVRPDDRIADSVGFYENRVSVCTQGDPVTDNSNQLAAESYHRVGDTGDNAADFTLATQRSPGEVSPAADLTAPEPVEPGALRVSELVAAGPGGTADEFVELANYGDAPLDLAGYSLHRCQATGQGTATPQVADLGPGTLAPGETFLATDDSAPAALRAIADAEYVTGMAETGYGVYLRAPDGSVADAVAVYETTDYSPCLQFGSELRNYTKVDLGESYQRARTPSTSGGDNEEDFMRTPGRTPGELADVEWVDPTEPLAGELDPVEIDQVAPPGTPVVERELSGDDDGYTAVVTTDDEQSGDLDVSARTATPVDASATRIWAGSTARPLPPALRVVGERRVATTPSLTTRTGGSAYAFQRFAVPVTDAADGLEFTWTGSDLTARDEVQLRAWDGEAWRLLVAEEPSADGDLTLVGAAGAEHVVDGELNVLVIDGPRVEGGAVDEIGQTDREFLDPSQYDLALSHITDTQFLAEGFQDVFRRMTTWTAANADARKIGYATNTGDIIENWLNGNSDPVRARKEFAASKRIWSVLNEAGVPNGVLPGNHDNFWGRSNNLYNEYFGPEMFADQPWWGDSWRPGDNSAHYDFVEVSGHEFLMLSLPYRPTEAQLDWGREVAAAYPDHNVVLLTHSYLTTEGEVEDRDDRYTARGVDVWSDLVAPSDNIFLVLGGHYHGVATKYGDPVTGEQVDAIEIANDAIAVRNTGATGRTVVQMLADYQGYRSTQPQPRADTLDRDTGFLRMLQLDVDAELMAVNTFSPHLDSHDAHTYDEAPFRGDQARYTATDDEFVARIDLLTDKVVATTAWGVTGPSTEVGTTSAAPGRPARIAVPDAVDGDLLTVGVADASGLVVRATRTVSLEPTPLAPTTTTLESTRASQRYGAAAQDRAQLIATVTGEVPEGDVELRSGDRLLGTVPLVEGTARWRAPARLAVGSTQIRAVFVPADESLTAGSSSAPVTLRVDKAVSRTRATLGETRRAVQVRVTLPEAVGVTPSGTVTVRVSGDGRTRVRTGRLEEGAVRVALPPMERGRAYRVVVRYPGDPRATGSSSPALVVRG